MGHLTWAIGNPSCIWLMFVVTVEVMMLVPLLENQAILQINNQFRKFLVVVVIEVGRGAVRAQVNMEEGGNIHHHHNPRVEISILVKAIHLLRIELEWEEPLIDITRSTIHHSIRVDTTSIHHMGEMEGLKVMRKGIHLTIEVKWGMHHHHRHHMGEEKWTAYHNMVGITLRLNITTGVEVIDNIARVHYSNHNSSSKVKPLVF